MTAAHVYEEAAAAGNVALGRLTPGKVQGDEVRDYELFPEIDIAILSSNLEAEILELRFRPPLYYLDDVFAFGWGFGINIATRQGDRYNIVSAGDLRTAAAQLNGLTGTKQGQSGTISASSESETSQITKRIWRRRPDLNRGWRFCRPLPYHLATAPIGLVRGMSTHPRPRAGRKKWSGKRDSNPRLRPGQGRTLPLSYSRPNPQSTTRLGRLSS